MSGYQWVEPEKFVRKLVDGRPIDQCPLIPADEKNQDWRTFEAWRNAGGVPLPESPAPVLVDARLAAVEALLAEEAKREDAPQAVKDYATERVK